MDAVEGDGLPQGQNGRADPTRSPAGTGQRQHILSVALSLMAQHGVDGTSMRDLAGAAGLNVASLYHYFPSKRDLLVAVLEDQGFVDTLTPTQSSSSPSLSRDPAVGLAALLTDMFDSMLQVEDFIRLMLGEVLRGDATAHSVGVDLFAATQESLEEWLTQTQPDLCAPERRPAMARVLRALIVGVFFEHIAGVLIDDDDQTSPVKALQMMAEESASFFEPRQPPPE